MSSPRFRMGTASGWRRPSSTRASRSSTSAPTSGWTTRRPTSTGTATRTRHPSLLGEFVYGIPELHREAIKQRQGGRRGGLLCDRRDPGAEAAGRCWAIKPESLIVDAASGVSGAGREAKEATGFSTVDGSFSAYGLLNHRHTAEMEMAIGGTVLFTPHLVPMTRGILATCYGEATGAADPLEVLREAYARSRLCTSPTSRPRPSGSSARTACN